MRPAMMSAQEGHTTQEAQDGPLAVGFVAAATLALGGAVAVTRRQGP